MAVCAFIHSDGVIKASVDQTACTELVLVSPIEFENLESGSLQEMKETLHLLFEFDAETFAVVELALILAFLTSHFGGRIVRWLGK